MLVLDHATAPTADQHRGAAPTDPRRAGWTLSIDFGTTYTVAAVVSADGSTRLIDIEGDGSSKMPSSVVLTDDGALVVGRAAVRQSVLYPANFEPTPKRLIGQGSVLLGERLVPVVDLIAAVLALAADEARRQQGGTEPDRVCLTHPAKWAQSRLDVLRAAAAAAGLVDVELVPEPVAAASRIGAAVVAVGQQIAVYDFGGGTFDAAVLVRTPDGFQVAGDPGGRDPLGGEDIDERILAYLGEGPLGERPEWGSLLTSPEPQWRRHRAELRRRVREAKEGLAKSLAHTLWIPGLECDYQLSRRELDRLIEADVQRTLDELALTIAAADVDAASLAGIYLVGGSSRICLVSELIRARFGIEPGHFEDPKAIVALGGASGRPVSRRGPAPFAANACRLGVHPPQRPGQYRQVDHWITTDAGRVCVHSVPNRWASLDAYVADELHQAHARGLSVDEPQWGEGLSGGAVLCTSAGADGESAASSYQLVGPWAVHARRPSTAPAGLDNLGAGQDPAQWSLHRPPITSVDGNRDNLDETVTVQTLLGGLPVTVTGRTHRIATGDGEHWSELYLARLIGQRPGVRAETRDGGRFSTGHSCRLARLKGRTVREWCWYGVVDGLGISITVEAPVPLTTGAATRLRDLIALFV